MASLTDQELAALEIACAEGGFAAIGNWAAVAEGLEERGLMRRLRDWNYAVTDAGRAAFAAAEDEDLRALVGESGVVIEGEVEQCPP